MYRFDQRQLGMRLTRLGDDQRLAFGLACAERLYPHYVAFSCDIGWGEPSVLRAALDAVWTKVCGHPHSTEVLRQLHKNVETMIPDADDFQGRSVSSAMDAGCAVSYLLQLVLGESEPGTIEEIADLAYATVDMLAQETPEFLAARPTNERQMILESGRAAREATTLAQPIVQRELRLQAESLDELDSANDIDSMIAFEKKWRAMGGDAASACDMATTEGDHHG